MYPLLPPNGLYLDLRGPQSLWISSHNSEVSLGLNSYFLVVVLLVPNPNLLLYDAKPYPLPMLPKAYDVSMLSNIPVFLVSLLPNNEVLPGSILSNIPVDPVPKLPNIPAV